MTKSIDSRIKLFYCYSNITNLYLSTVSQFSSVVLPVVLLYKSSPWLVVSLWCQYDCHVCSNERPFHHWTGIVNFTFAVFLFHSSFFSTPGFNSLCRPVPCCAVPCRTEPHRAVLCCAVPCRVVPCCTVLCRTMPCRTVLWCAVLCCAVPCCTVLCCSMPYYAVLCCAVPCCTMPCRTVLYCVMP